jgi:hypothetical protein
MTGTLLAPGPRAALCAPGSEFSLARSLSGCVELLENAR